jgi:hypothetical protein
MYSRKRAIELLELGKKLAQISRKATENNFSGSLSGDYDAEYIEVAAETEKLFKLCGWISPK